jgi:hypothetical protein
MTLLLNQKSERAKDWSGGMGLVTEEEQASGCEDKVIVYAPYSIVDDDT